MAFERLFEDPMAAIGYGLLVAPENPLAMGFDTLQKAQAAKSDRDDADFNRQLKIITMQNEMRKAQMPDFNVNTATGEFFDKNTGQVYVNQGGRLQPMGGGQATPTSGEYINPAMQKFIEQESFKADIAAKAAARAESAKRDEESRKAERDRAAAAEKLRLEKVAELRSMESKMPSLEKNIGEMSGLAEKATYTPVGQALDAAARAFGYSTEGANASVDYTSRIDNQILPLLRDTFGAAFTAAEGDRLRATLGREDLTPEQKQIVLNNFITQKKNDIDAKRLEVGLPVKQAQPASFTPMDAGSLSKMTPQQRQPYRAQLLQMKGGQ